MALIFSGGGVVSASGFDPDAISFLTTAAITDTTERYAVNYLVTNLKFKGLWDLMEAAYPCVGSNSTKQSWNLRDTTKYQLTYTGGITNDANGIRGNGTNAYADPGFQPSSVPGWVLGEGSYSVYITASDVTSSVGEALGGRKTISPLSRISLNPRSGANNAEFCMDNTATSVDIANASIEGFYGLTRLNTSDVATVIRNGAAATAALSAVNILESPIYLLARRNINSGGANTTSNYLDSTIGWAHLSRYKLTTGQLEDLQDVVQQFQTILGREV